MEDRLGRVCSSRGGSEGGSRSWAERHSDRDDYFDVGPGDHMPSRCPECGAAGKLTAIETDQDMSEGEEAEYEAGMWGFAFCRACQSNVFWQL